MLAREPVWSARRSPTDWRAWILRAVAAATKIGRGTANQTSAAIIRTNSHRRLPLQASVSTSPNPIIAGGHTPAIAPLMAIAFAASADAAAKFDFRVCSAVAVMITPCRRDAGTVLQQLTTIIGF